MNHFYGSRAGYRCGTAGLWVVALLSVGCGSYGFKYLHPTEPRCAGRIRDAPPALVPGDTFTVASFNIKFAQNVERASPPSGNELCSCHGPDYLSARGVPQRDVFR